MKALVLFDTGFGNTKIIAEKIAETLGNNTVALPVLDADTSSMKNIDLLVAGSPIIAWNPTKKMQDFLAGLAGGKLKGIKAAAFDTRIKTFISGNGAAKISKKLETAGAEIITGPEFFYVKDREGPLLQGETEKAAEWAKKIREISGF